MRKSQIGMPLMAAVVAVAAMVIGCATTGVGPTPADEIIAMLADYQAAWEAQDVDRMVMAFSDNYSDSAGLNKEAVRSTYERLAAQGILQSIAVWLEECEIVVDGDSAIATPLVTNTPTGKFVYRTKLRREVDGVWRFINMELMR